MRRSFGIRLGAVLAVVVLLSVLLVPSASAGCAVYHRVQRGEILSRIAARYGVSMWAIAQANGIRNIDRIYAGQVLVIPVCPKPAPPPCPQPCPPRPVPPPPPPPAPWQGQYYNNPYLSGWPVLVRSDRAVNFNWGWGSPGAQVPPDNFSARWTKTWAVSGGTYRLMVRSDDGFRVLMDGRSLLEAWIVQPVTYYARDVYIPYGYHTFTVEYFESGGLAEISVWFQRLY
jgi:hypothetical protein